MIAALSDMHRDLRAELDACVASEEGTALSERGQLQRNPPISQDIPQWPGLFYRRKSV